MSYIANKRNEANLTNIHWYSTVAGAWSPNLLGAALPYALLPAVPAAGDVVVFGIDTSLPDSGPFCSLVFNLLTAQVDLTTVTWRYSDAGVDPTAWGALTVQDNTNADGAMTGDPFDTAGVRSVHWEQPSDWVDTLDPTIGGNALGVTGYWVCAHVSVVGAAPSAPIQQINHPYSITWPWIEVQSTAVLGDVAALIQDKLENQADNWSGGNPVMIFNRVFLGLRSTSRGADFTPFINLADEQNPTGITVTAGAGTAFATDMNAPSGRTLQYTTGAADPLAVRASVAFNTALSSQFYGVYHVFLRLDRVGSTTGDIIVQMNYELSSGGQSIVLGSHILPHSQTWVLLDYGRLTIPGPPMSVADAMQGFILRVLASSANAGRVVTFYDVILIPVDEWGGEYRDPKQVSATQIVGDQYLDVDGIYLPKRGARALVRNVTADTVTASYVPIQPSSPMLWSNTEQRLYTLSALATTPVTDTVWQSKPWIAQSVTIDRITRYLSMRGDR
jgi:hypothetical protein